MNVSPNHRYLEHNGAPFFYLADTSWKLFTEPTLEEADLYLRTRKEQGFSVVMPVLATERSRGEESERSALMEDDPTDPTRPNETYFARCDKIIDRANELGLWVAILPTWGSYVGGNPRDEPLFDEQSIRRYGEYVARRYKDRNVIWVNGGDRLSEDPKHQALWRALAAGMNAGDDTGTHVMTYHPPGLNHGGHSSRWFHDDEWLDFNLLQTGVRYWEDDLCAHYVADYTRAPVKPFIEGETRYENSNRNFGMPRPTGPKATAFHVRQAAYYAMLCGAAGHTYGCRDVWSFYVPSDEPPTRCVDTHWKVALRFAGAEQLRHWRALFERYPWHRLTPDLPTITAGIGPRGGDKSNMDALVTYGAWDGTGNIRTPAALADDRSFALIYVPQPMPIWVDLAKVGGDRPVEAIWYDPRTGEEKPHKRFHQKEETRFFPPVDPSGQNIAEPDWVLILRAS